MAILARAFRFQQNLARGRTWRTTLGACRTESDGDLELTVAPHSAKHDRCQMAERITSVLADLANSGLSLFPLAENVGQDG
jgi:hypothetical protein